MAYAGKGYCCGSPFSSKEPDCRGDGGQVMVRVFNPFLIGRYRGFDFIAVAAQGGEDFVGLPL
jgi:hypothetical protein